MSSQGQYPGPPGPSYPPPPGPGMGAPPQPMPPGITSQTMPVMASPAPVSAGGSRGSSRALPIVVAAGLAVGVFGGLIIIYGTNPGGDAEAASAAASSDAGNETGEPGDKVASDDSKKADVIDAGAKSSFDAAAVAVATDAATKLAAIDAGSPDAAPVVASKNDKPPIGSKPNTGDPKRVTTPAAPKSATFKFVVEPADVSGLKITVDGKTASGGSYSLTSDKRRVRIRASARGYVTWSRSYNVRDATVKIRMRRPAKRKDPSGLIDL